MSLLLDTMSAVIRIEVYYRFFMIVKVQLMARLQVITICSTINLIVSAILTHYFTTYFPPILLYSIPNCHYFLHFTILVMIVFLSNQLSSQAYLKFIAGRDSLILRVQLSLIYQHLAN